MNDGAHATRRKWSLKGKAWTPTDNSTPAAKCAIRLWLLDNMKRTRTLECYGSEQSMFWQVWCKHAESVAGATGDALTYLRAANLDYDIFDVDCYGSPYEAIEIIGQRALPDRIAIAATDGSLRRSAMMRSKISSYLCEKGGFDNEDKRLKAAIFHRYPVFCRLVLERILSGWQIDQFAVKYAEGGAWKNATAYFGIILQRSQDTPAGVGPAA